MTFSDPQGVQIGTRNFALQPSGHVSLLLNLSYPFTAGLTGTVEFTSDNGSIVGLGLRFNPTGPFTSTTRVQSLRIQSWTPPKQRAATY